MKRHTVTCAGPHIEPVALYVTELPDEAPAPDHGALCDECTDVYRVGVSGILPAARMAPGRPPSFAAVEAVKRARVPDWAPGNYRRP